MLPDLPLLHCRCRCAPPFPTRPSLALTPAHASVPRRARAAGEDPCAFTASGFPRRTSPCGANGNCTLLDTKSALTPHQWEFNCTCLGNYEGERCERCSPGYTIASGCADVARKSADGLIVQSAGYVKTFAAVGMSLMAISLASLAVNLVGSFRKDKGIVRPRAPIRPRPRSPRPRRSSALLCTSA